MQTESPTDQRTEGSLHPMVIPLATPEDVPINIAKCPECGGKLRWQATTTDILEDMLVECENEDEDCESDWTEDRHKFHQGDWQPVIERVRGWVKMRYNADISDRR